MKLLLIGCLTFLSTPIWAYIPSYRMILSRTADNHGNGIYKITQNIHLRNQNKDFSLRESWIIYGAKKMRLTVTGTGTLTGQIQRTYIYNDNKRYFIDSNGQKRMSALPADWFEHFFHFRYSKKMHPLLVKNKIVPQSYDFEEPKISKPEDVSNTPESFTRLTRIDGSIAYGIGPTSFSNQLMPGLWIEQDTFLIQKLRLPSKTEIVAKNYEKFKRSLWLPRQREIRWNNHTAKIILINTQAISSSSKNQAKVHHSSLNASTDGTLRNLPISISEVAEFYDRFR